MALFKVRAGRVPVFCAWDVDADFMVTGAVGIFGLFECNVKTMNCMCFFAIELCSNLAIATGNEARDVPELSSYVHRMTSEQAGVPSIENWSQSDL